MRKTFSPIQKAQVATAVLNGRQSISQIASEHEVHPTQVNQWAKLARDGLPLLFSDKRTNEHKDFQDRLDRLNKIIGQRECELEWLKKKLHVDSP